jgi:CRP-like cAMP-binding protein
MDFQPLLDHIGRHVQLTSEEKSNFLTKVKSRKYLKNQFVVQAGDICRHESFVLSGCLKTFYLDSEGHEHIVMFAIEDWWTADLGSFITQTPADLNIQCLEDSELAQVSYGDLQQLYVETPKLERFFRIIIQNAFVAAQKRVINNLSLSAMDRYIGFREQYSKIEQRVPQYMIASYLGITREFLSKIRAQLAK